MSLRVALVATLALLALPAAASAAGAPPYDITNLGGATLLVAPTASSSTLAVQVRHVGASLEFTPAAMSAAGCTSTLVKTTCPDALAATELRLQGAVLDVDVALSGMTVGTVRLAGGSASDALVVDGPAAPFAVGAVVLDPGTGNDSVKITGNVHGVTLAAADPGGDDSYDVQSTSPAIGGSLDAGAGNDVVASNAPNLTLLGGDGADTLSGAGPLQGGTGDDVLEPSATGKAAVGGDGIDVLSYRLLSTPLTLTNSSATDVVVTGDGVTKTGIESLVGGTGNDTITGSGAQDVLSGGQGDDVIEGRGGGDVLDGGPGVNTVSYALGPGPVAVDLLAGTGGALALDTLKGFRRVITGPGADVVTGTSADEQFVLGDGDDTLGAGAGNDTADGGPGNDTLRGGADSDQLDGGAGSDTTTYDERGSSEPVNVSLATPGGDGAAGENDTLANIESVTGGASNDTLSGDANANVLVGGPGVNTLDGQGGDDQLFGGEGRDVITGGPGNDSLFGAGDDDSLNAADASKPDADVVACGDSLDDDAQVDATDTVTGCEYSSRADVSVPVDEDQDGFVGGFDCDDHDPSRNQGVTDVPGDGIDQDCDGFDTPVPFVDYGLSASISKPTGRRRGIKFTRLVVTRLSANRTVRIACTSPRHAKTGKCPFKKATRKPKSGASQVSLTSLLRGRRLAVGTKVEFSVTAPKLNGRVRRFTVRATSLRSQELCLVAPSSKPRTCPEGDEL